MKKISSSRWLKLKRFFETVVKEKLNLVENYKKTRSLSQDICSALNSEDTVIQTIEDVSPPKWHLGHTTWFFETFLLIPFLKSYSLFHEKFNFIFNSYYESVGDKILRSNRGYLSRPTLEKVLLYRKQVDEAMQVLMHEDGCDKENSEIRKRIMIGIHHEQQHQELLYTDIKHIFFSNPIRPVYDPSKRPIPRNDASRKLNKPKGFTLFEGALATIGTHERSFGYDNEFPRHSHFLYDFQLRDSCVTNEEYLEFIEDGGYSKPEYWLSDGWDHVQKNKWVAPLYWEKQAGQWFEFTLQGFHDLDLKASVCHVCFFEADAFARWSKRRLPTEFEWEFSSGKVAPLLHNGNLLEKSLLHPIEERISWEHLIGNVWEWTSSAYLPYPGFRPLTGALKEYNGKFMNGQRVLKGGSCVTPMSHIRTTYRNFFQPEKRWQFTGIRLADNVK